MTLFDHLAIRLGFLLENIPAAAVRAQKSGPRRFGRCSTHVDVYTVSR